MKQISAWLICILVGICLAHPALEVKRSKKALLAERIGMKITREFIRRLDREVQRGQVFNNNPLASIIPPVDDPATLNPIDLPNINIPIPDLFTVCGSLGFGEATVTGLSQLKDNFALTGVGNVTATWEMSLPIVSIDTTYNMDLILELGSVHSIVGSGKLDASVGNVFFNLEAKGRIPLITSRPIGLDSLDVDLGFSNLILSADEATIDGDTVIDWQEAATNIETYFHTIWNDEVRGIVNEVVRCSIDHVVNTCTPNDLLNENFDCLKLEINPSCFESIVNQDEAFFPIEYLTAADTCSASPSSTPSNPSTPNETTEEQTAPNASTEGSTTPNEPTVAPEPTGSTDPPATVAPEPTGSTEAPGTDEPQPTESSDPPATDEPQPTEPTELPATDESQPTEDGSTSEGTEPTEATGGKATTSTSFSLAMLIFVGFSLILM